MWKHSTILKALCKWMERWCYWGQGRSKGVLFFTVSQCFWVTPTAPDPGSVGSPALRTKKNQWPQSWLHPGCGFSPHSPGYSLSPPCLQEMAQMSRWRFTCGCSLGAIYMKERRVKKVLLWPSRAKGCRLFSSGAGKCKRGRKFRLYSRTLKCCASRGVGRRRVIHRRLLNSLHDRVSSVIISEVIQTFGGGGWWFISLLPLRFQITE